MTTAAESNTTSFTMTSEEVPSNATMTTATTIETSTATTINEGTSANTILTNQTLTTPTSVLPEETTPTVIPNVQNINSTIAQTTGTTIGTSEEPLTTTTTGSPDLETIQPATLTGSDLETIQPTNITGSLDRETTQPTTIQLNATIDETTMDIVTTDTMTTPTEAGVLNTTTIETMQSSTMLKNQTSDMTSMLTITTPSQNTSGFTNMTTNFTTTYGLPVTGQTDTVLGLPTWQFAVVVGACGLFLLVLIIVVVAVVCRRKRKRGKLDYEKTREAELWGPQPSIPGFGLTNFTDKIELDTIKSDEASVDMRITDYPKEPVNVFATDNPTYIESPVFKMKTNQEATEQENEENTNELKVAKGPIRVTTPVLERHIMSTNDDKPSSFKTESEVDDEAFLPPPPSISETPSPPPMSTPPFTPTPPPGASPPAIIGGGIPPPPALTGSIPAPPDIDNMPPPPPQMAETNPPLATGSIPPPPQLDGIPPPPTL